MRVLTFILAIGLLGSSLAAEANAQSPKRDWTPYEDNPDCLVTRHQMKEPGGTDVRSKPIDMIMGAYIWGGRVSSEAMGRRMEDFENACLMKDANEQCGYPYDRGIGKLVKRRGSKYHKRRDARRPGGELYKLLDEMPPPAAIRLAERSVGLCFGRNGTTTSLNDLDLVRVEYPTRFCQDLIRNRRLSHSGLSTQERDQLDGWIAAYAQFSNTLARTGQLEDPDQCKLVPRSIVGQLQARQAEDVKQSMAEIAKIMRHSRRSVEERIAGLNGCQIAYALVYQGLNGASQDRVPDTGISWALSYERANLNNLECPNMPSDLNEWVQRQPLEKFEAVPDPYAVFRQTARPPQNTDWGWNNFVRQWMSRYETVDASNECEAIRYFVGLKYIGDQLRYSKDDTPLHAFHDLFQVSGDERAKRIKCKFTPTSILPQVRQAWSDRADQIARNNAPPPQEPPNPFKPTDSGVKSYLWTNVPTTRCYRSGGREYCFTS